MVEKSVWHLDMVWRMKFFATLVIGVCNAMSNSVSVIRVEYCDVILVLCFVH